MSSGTVTTGAVVSTTVTVKVADPVLSLLSVAEQVTVVTPSGKVLPDGGVQVAVIEPSTASLAVAVNVTTAPAGPVASVTMLLGTVITGGIVSCMTAFSQSIRVSPSVGS